MTTVHRLVTRKLYPLVTTLTMTRTRAKGREYERAYVRVPPETAARIAGGKRKTYVVALIGRASHLHAQYWDTRDDPLWPRLDPQLRRELEVLGNTAWSPGEVILIPATRRELEELGLDPSQPVTLDSIVEAVRRRLEQEAHWERATASAPEAESPRVAQLGRDLLRRPLQRR